jgi:DNA-binding CsgD family transcriptional regulator
VKQGDTILALTEHERQILLLNAKGLSDYRIARRLRMDPPNVYRARKTALRKLAQAKIDLSLAESLHRK